MTFVFFHGGCMDGLGALWAFKKAHKVPFIAVPMVAGSKLDRDIFDKYKDVEKDAAYFLDVSPHKEDVAFLRNTFFTLFIIDHHVLDRGDYSLFRIIHDLAYSGATLTWKLYFGEENMPTILKYIQDRDIWTWKLPDSKAVSEYLFRNVRTPKDPSHVEEALKQFDAANDLVNTDLEKVVDVGKRHLELAEAQIKGILTTARKALWDGKYTVYHCPTILYRSEIGARLMENKDADFAVCWSYSVENDEFWLSLRSREGKTDVQAIAKQFGAGGHVCSAGATLTYDQFHRVLKPFEEKKEEQKVTA